MPPAEIALLAALGLFAGAIGGLVGVGGSIVIIPGLTLLLGRNQHLSQAAAMIINVVVAASALLQHHRAEAVRWPVVARMLPFGLVFVLIGVAASNLLEGRVLMRIYGAFLVYVVIYNVVKLFGDQRPSSGQPPIDAGWARVGIVGGLMGLAAGLLGIGGAPVSIPLLQRLNHLPLRQAIATTSAVMVLTALLGATGKNLTLAHLPDAGSTADLGLRQSVLLATFLAPTAILGALLGARLTHVLPVRLVRLAFILLMIWAAAEMLGPA